MNPEEQNLLHYINTILVLKNWKKSGLISDEDYIKMEAKTARKFGIKNVSLYRSIDLLYKPFRVIYIHNKKRKSYIKKGE